MRFSRNTHTYPKLTVHIRTLRSSKILMATARLSTSSSLSTRYTRHRIAPLPSSDSPASASPQRGNLQDAINANSINNTHFSETEMLRYFKGTCEAIRAMHDYHAPIGSSSRANQSSSARHAPSQPNSPRNSVDEDDEMFPHPEGDGEGGYSYHGPGSSANVPLMSKNRPEDNEPIFDGDEELDRIQHQNGKANSGQTELVPYAHRDLKPGYVVSRNIL